MKRIFAILLPLVFIGFVGCGGGDDEEPPPKPQNADENTLPKQSLADLMAQASKMKQSCSSGLSPVFMMAAQGMSQPNGSGQYGSASGAGPNPALLSMLGGGAGGASGGDCNNDMMNMLMAFTTIAYKNKQGQTQNYANDPTARQWLATQVAGIVNRIGQSLTAQGIQITPDLRSKLFAFAIDYSQKNLLSGMPSGLGSQVSAGLAQYTSGIPSLGSILGGQGFTGTGSTTGTSATGTGSAASGSQYTSTLGNIADFNQGTTTSGGISTDALGSTLLDFYGTSRGIAGSSSSSSKKANPNFGGFVPVE